MQQLMEAASYMAHGYCLLWQPWLVAVHAGSDIAIALAYFAIPAAILIFLRRRRDLQFSGLAILFAAFILLCGLTHVFGAITLWAPIYEAQAFVKLATALVSIATAMVIFPLIPKALAIPSPAVLQSANAELEAEIAAHEKTLAELRAIKAELEARVQQRTAEVEEANQRLRILTREVIHRSKNLMTVVQSLASQTAKTSADKSSFLQKLTGRLTSLSDALDAVVRNQWQGADMADLVGTQLGYYFDAYPDRIAISGPRYLVRPEAAQQIGLAVHELATNAVKYGALSRDRGRVAVQWRQEEGAAAVPVLVFEWREIWEPQGTALPARADGFGSLLLDKAVPTALRGSASRRLAADGMVYLMTMPEAELRPRPRPDDGDSIHAAFASPGAEPPALPTAG